MVANFNQTLTLSLSKGVLAGADRGQRKRRPCRLFPSILPEANRPGILRPVPDDIPYSSSSPPPMMTGLFEASMTPVPFM